MRGSGGLPARLWWAGLLLATVGCVELGQSLDLLPNGKVRVIFDYAVIAQEELFPVAPWLPEVDEERVDGAVFLAGGRQIIVWRRWGRVALFDTASHELLTATTTSPLERASVSPDGTLIATLDGASGAVSILRLPSLEELNRFDVPADSRYFLGVDWSPDGRWLLGHDMRGIAFLLDIQSGEYHSDLVKGATAWAWVAAPKGSRLVAALGEHLVGDALVPDSPAVQTGEVAMLVVGPGGGLAVLAGGQVSVGNAGTLDISPVELPWPASDLTDQGEWLLAFGKGMVAVLDWEGNVLHDFALDADLPPVRSARGGVMEGGHEPAWLTTLSRDGSQMVHCLVQRHGAVIGLRAGEEPTRTPVPVDPWKIGTCSFGPAGETVLVDQGVGTVLFWPLDGSGKVVPIPGESAKYRGQPRFSDDGAHLMTKGPDKQVEVWRWSEIRAFLLEPTIWDRLPAGVFRPAGGSHVLDMHALGQLIAWRSYHACLPEGFYMGGKEDWEGGFSLLGSGTRFISKEVTRDGALCRQRVVLEFPSMGAYNGHASGRGGGGDTAMAYLGVKGLVVGPLEGEEEADGSRLLRVRPRAAKAVARQFAAGCRMSRAQCNQFLGFPIKFRIRVAGFAPAEGSEAYMEDGWAVWETTLGDWLTLVPTLIESAGDP